MAWTWSVAALVVLSSEGAYLRSSAHGRTLIMGTSSNETETDPGIVLEPILSENRKIDHEEKIIPQEPGRLPVDAQLSLAKPPADDIRQDLQAPAGQMTTVSKEGQSRVRRRNRHLDAIIIMLIVVAIAVVLGATFFFCCSGNNK